MVREAGTKIGSGDVAESVDATDLKSVDFLNREGSSPSIPKRTCMPWWWNGRHD